MISATELARWAGTTPAQSELPRLVRRLVHAAASLTQISFPAGDSIASPGFDGELHSHEGNAWVPAGFSAWELSCRGDVGTKANEDFDKRCAATPESVRATRTYVAVTARRWPGKAKWRDTKAALGLWADVRAYDADDIEQWLEQSPAVALAFGGELGLSGVGVEAVSGYFGRWGGQCRPAISPSALLAGRTEQAAAHLDRIRAIMGGQVRDPLAVKADSVEEAVAFAAAALLGEPELEATAVVVTGAEGWRFVEVNPNVRIAIAGSPAIAEAPVVRDGLAVIVPYASGDIARLFAGVASKLDDNELSLERAMHHEFEKALGLIGVEGNDARRLAALCGRSWSVFRRQHAVNPAIRRPAWLDHPASAALALLCLAGAWSSAHDADVKILERIAGRSYGEIEAELLALERLDDSPVLHIGKVWKAKSALELLALFGDRIEAALLDRYFAEVETVLAAPDPQLELPDSERYAASIKGKVRPISGMLIEALCDTLVKLAVRGPEVPALAVRDIAGRIDRLVRHLLFGADRIRWLSLASQLPALAEASPHEFLSAVEDGIAAPDGAARAVFHETSGTGFGSRCWHSGMLWALETLAWAPNRLRRVALILARLSDIQIAGNWANSPRASLQDIFRPWFPQTGATIDQRISTLDYLVEQTPDVTFALFDHMTDTGLDHASYIARPKWRDDDAGAGHGATARERQQMLVAAIDRLLVMAKGYPDRIRELVDKYMTLDATRRGRIITLLGECEAAGDHDREAVRSALRRKLFWHRNYDEKRPPAELDALLAPLEEAYDRLEPDDLIVRHGWLFNAGFADLPERRPRDGFEGRRKAAAEAAQAALRDIYAAHGWAGVMRLAEEGGNPGVVGAALARIGLPVEDLDHWIVADAADLWADEPRTRIATSLLLAEPVDTRLARVDRLLAAAAASGRDADWQARLLMLLPHDPAIWDRAEHIGRTAYYWQTCDANLWTEAPADKLAALRQFVAHKRPVSALNACYTQFEGVPAALVMEMLEAILQGQEIGDGVMPHSYVFQYALDHIEADGSVDETRLAQVEFALIPFLGYTNEHHARTLYRIVMSQPGTFVELLCLLYKPRHRDKAEEDEKDETAKANAETVWRVLHACEYVPGTQADGSIDAGELKSFVAEARRMAAAEDRAAACDTTLGQILAHAPEGADGIWPAEVVRDVFEAEASEKMFEGLWVGCMNKRGVHSRGAYEGGDQERDLAADYRRHGNALEASHPRLGASVLSIADHYDRHGLFEDMDARLRQEGH